MRFGAGQRTLRTEDQRLVTGRGQYTDDHVLDGTLHLSILRANVAHADIISVDVSKAAARPGVVAVASGRDLLADGLRPIPIMRSYPGADGTGSMQSPPRFAVAADRIRHVGEVIAVVVANTARGAEDALEDIIVETSELDPVVDISAAIEKHAPTIGDGAGGNVVTAKQHGDREAVEAEFARAVHRCALTVTNQRLFPAPLEPRSALAYPDTEPGRTILLVGTQNPTAVHQQLAETLNCAAEELRIKVPDIGGGFGMKGYLYPEDVLVTHFARRFGKPVKWCGSRMDDFLGSGHARDQLVAIEAAFDDKYRITALRSLTHVNLGAYPGPAGPILALNLGPKVATNVYDIALIDLEIRGVLTNTQATGPYRGAGRPEAIYAIERLLDQAASEFGISPAMLRLRNLVKAKQMPYRNAMGETYDSGNFPEVLDRVLAEAGWDTFDTRRKQSRKQGLLRGRGLSMFVEWTGGNAFTEAIRIVLDAKRRIAVETAVIPMGQGISTSFAQIVAAVFEIDIADVDVRTGDTAMANGFGSFGSRSLFVGGSAVAAGARDALDALNREAASTLEVSVADVRYANGAFFVDGTDHRIGLFDLVGRRPEKEAVFSSTHAVRGETWPNGAHVCEVEINEHTGETRLARYTCVDDIGAALNPMIVEGQIVGGVAQGVGQALHEGVIYHPDGQLITATLQDYGLPRASDMSKITSVLHEGSPSTNNPLGVKGAGESGAVGAPPAVIAAVLDALRPLGVSHIDMPATQARIWRAINDARSSTDLAQLRLTSSEPGA
jgi:Aerobic-type carbon monoxide dehydrogenase, large subunit CoxL/CutL homologs